MHQPEPNIETHGAIVLPDSALDVIKRNVVAGRKVLPDARRGTQPLSEPQHRRRQVIAEIAKATQGQRHRGEQTGLTDNELAFYDAMLTNDSARLMTFVPLPAGQRP